MNEKEIFEKYKDGIKAIQETEKIIEDMSFMFFYNKVDELKIDEHCKLKIKDKNDLLNKIDTNSKLIDNVFDIIIEVDGKEYIGKCSCSSDESYNWNEVKTTDFKYEVDIVEKDCPYIVSIYDFTKRDKDITSEDAYIKFVVSRKETENKVK